MASVYREFLGIEFNGPVGTSPVRLFNGDPALGGDVDTDRAGVICSVCTPGGVLYVHRVSAVSGTRFFWRVPYGNTKFVELLGHEEIHVVADASDTAVALQQVLV